MRSIICTLFESHYHYGVAALTNSLVKQGFEGTVCAGYRGPLPKWVENFSNISPVGGIFSYGLQISPEVTVNFLPLTTDAHLTNYKPDFMLHLLAAFKNDVNAIFYFDPDIVITAPWKVFERWVECGVAVSEDVNSPLPKFHPRRMAWRDYFGERGFNLKFKEALYANGGFQGVKVADASFLLEWKNIQEAMAPAIGGLNRSSFVGSLLDEDIRGPFEPFNKTDQDALNAAIESWEGNVSFVGKVGMAFEPGAALMPHALGKEKPWKKSYTVEALRGRGPRAVDKDYWCNVEKPIQVYSQPYIRFKKLSINFSALIARFYSR